MAAFISGLILVVIFFLTGTSVVAEVPVSYPVQDSVANKKTAANHRASTPGMQWEILPGEDILQIARLMFPKDSVARDKFIRTIIHTNSEHFPAGTYQPLPTGTIIYIPDLRMINTYSGSSATTRKPSVANNLTRRKSQATPEAVAPSQNNNHLLLQLITQLEQAAENEVRELNTLTKRIESLASQPAEIQSIFSLNVAKPNEKQANSANTSLEENIQHLKDSVTPPGNNTQHLEDPILPEETSDVPMEIPLSSDSLFLGLGGVLLTLLIVIMMLRNYRRIKERLTRSPDASLLPETTERHQYETLLLRRNDKTVNLPENTPNATGRMMFEAGSLIEQDNPEAAIQLLQKQLVINKHDISGWLLLFELLYKSSNKRDFKKNARRFKRLGEFPGIWVQIQDLGHRLDSNESLYFDEQKRKEKFFPDSINVG